MLQFTPEEHEEFVRLAERRQLSAPQLVRLLALAQVGTLQALEAGAVTPAEAAKSAAKIVAEAYARGPKIERLRHQGTT